MIAESCCPACPGPGCYVQITCTGPVVVCPALW